jgi:hypothetical protein
VTPVRWACVVAALGAAAWLLLDPLSADLAAQRYRAGLVDDAGLGVWDNGWFAGHHTPAYSVLFPPLAAVVGVAVAGAACAVVAAALFARLARSYWGCRAGTLAAIWFALGVTATLVSGRLTFLLGVAIGVAAMLALRSARPALAAALAFATTLASPVAGLFVALAALALGLAATRPPQRFWGVTIALAALAPGVALAVLFPEGGTEPFVASAFWPALVATVAVALALPARERALRLGAGLYALLCVAAFVIATPLGGNVTRLGALLAGPVLAGALLSEFGPARRAARSGRAAAPGALLRRFGPRSQTMPSSRQELAPASPPSRCGPRSQVAAPTSRRVPAVLLALALPLAYWQWYPAVRDVVRAADDPSTAAGYYAPLIEFLQSKPGTFRVEIPFTANHWEAAHVAPHVPLARGWERQLDRKYGALFYDGSLDGATYRAWLDEHAVAYVALPDADLDYSSAGEARLLRRGLPYLRPVWRDAHWRVFAVRRPAPLVSGAATRIKIDPDAFTITATRPGDVLVRIRHSRWWAVTDGRACVHRATGGMTRVRVRAPGRVRVQARLRGSTCRR